MDIRFFDFTRTDICDYAYPLDNEYFGEFNEGCLNYEPFFRPFVETEPEEPEQPTSVPEDDDEEEEEEVTDPIEEEPEEEEDEECVSDNTTYDTVGNNCADFYDKWEGLIEYCGTYDDEDFNANI